MGLGDGVSAWRKRVRWAKHVGWLRAWPCLLWIGAGCIEPEPALPPAPAKRFVLGKLKVDQRRDGQTRWHITAVEAEGDLNQVVARDVWMQQPKPTSARKDALPMTVRAPQAVLELNTDRAHFEDFILHDSYGGRLAGKTADLDDQAERWVAQGPLLYTKSGLRIESVGGAISNLATDTTLIDGPVRGRWKRPDAATLLK